MHFSQQSSRCLNNDAVVFFLRYTHFENYLKQHSPSLFSKFKCLSIFWQYTSFIYLMQYTTTAMCLIFNSSLIKNLLRELEAITIKYGSKVMCVHVCICLCSILVFYGESSITEYERDVYTEIMAQKYTHHKRVNLTVEARAGTCWNYNVIVCVFIFKEKCQQHV